MRDLVEQQPATGEHARVGLAGLRRSRPAAFDVQHLS